MRDIKFRAWDKESKTMLALVHQIDFLNKYIWAEGNGEHAIGVSLKGFELMQFTGLHDKNGKEIYEGDIVELRQETSRGSEYLLTLIVKWSDDGLNYNVYPCHDEKYWEVIGNIYDYKSQL